jgi:hypothetical protein
MLQVNAASGEKGGVSWSPLPTDWRQTGGNEGCGPSVPSLPAPYRPNPPPLQPLPGKQRNPHAARDCNDEHASATHWHASPRLSHTLPGGNFSFKRCPTLTDTRRETLTTPATVQSRCVHVSLHRGGGIGGPNGHGALSKWGRGLLAATNGLWKIAPSLTRGSPATQSAGIGLPTPETETGGEVALAVILLQYEYYLTSTSPQPCRL